MPKSKLSIDPIHEAVDIFDQQLTQDVWRDKYRWGTESSPYESFRRVTNAVYVNDTTANCDAAYEAMCSGLWMPGGRIHAGAGTGKRVTFMNCYVDRKIEDSMDGIADALKDAMLTMQQGGGIGMDFSLLRPPGAILRRTGAIASGPGPFIDMWDSMCRTIMSAGDRRGAMMGTLICDHPFLPEFITAKKEGQRWRMFNVSVLVTDAFMEAVREDADWPLGHNVPPYGKDPIAVIEREDGPWYVYSVWKARELWDLILRTTYDYAEPGVIFIDRVNDMNNLAYCETISCTNPCGEQPLPPNGTCNLGAVNLARMVWDPFTPKARFDFRLLTEVVRIGMRFLDNVIDVTPYPLAAQEAEEKAKRRTGLGIAGLGNALAMLNLRYGSPGAVSMTNEIMCCLKCSAYRASIDLAKERGPFPLYDDRYHTRPFIQYLPNDLIKDIRQYGIRNGVLLTIAPTGTTSIYYGNVSGGVEPVFAHEVRRKVLQRDGTYKEYTAYDYGMLVHRAVAGESTELPPSMVEAQDLSTGEHLSILAACQNQVDASVSKTINCPRDMTFEEFGDVYWQSYKIGCKSCTTYRPSDVRGSILERASDVKEKEEKAASKSPAVLLRPLQLAGTTYKVKWPTHEASWYVTINNLNNKPFEIFITSKSARHTEWTTALTLMITSHLRKGEDIDFIVDELKQVASTYESAWIEGRHYPSIVAYIAHILERHVAELSGGSGSLVPLKNPTSNYEPCPSCGALSYAKQEGCGICMSCGHTDCG